MGDNKNTTDKVTHYHETTKHHLHRYAAGPDALDWDDQPEAFRWFNDAPKTDLPLVADNIATPYADLYNPHTAEPHALSLENIACLLELSFGLSAWKQYDNAKWALRCNPSSGNLHAEEAYAITNQQNALEAGVYHYLSRDHQLEQRCAMNQTSLPDNTLLIGISSIQWREAWKYGERAFRYCNLDTGHAIACVSYAAAALGWKVKLLDQVSDSQIASLLGINRTDDFGKAEQEHPDVLLQISTTDEFEVIDIDTLIKSAQQSNWQGHANQLSTRHMYNWPIIDEVSIASEKPETNATESTPHELPEPHTTPYELSAPILIRRRRSAQAFDGKTHITSQAFYRMLDMTLPRADTTPWTSTPWRDNINLVLFIHRVEGIKPGLYTLVRNPNTFDAYKTTLQREQFEWQPVEDCPSHIPLYKLVNANGQKLAATLSCHQGIAADSCFSLGMIADCSPIETASWHYRRLYWEAGMIGQVLYLEAEAAGIQGTGIGCYFDDALHEALGINDKRWQSLYHFTVGKGIGDARIQTIPAYGHLDR